MRTKEPKISSVKIIVVPEFYNYVSKKTESELQIMDAENLLKEIIRHCDGIDNAYVSYDSYYTCEYCGSVWTEFKKTYNGGCCKKDELNNPEGE
jgi:protein-arginine kinase activator protein McsA